MKNSTAGIRFEATPIIRENELRSCHFSRLTSSIAGRIIESRYTEHAYTIKLDGKVIHTSQFYRTSEKKMQSKGNKILNMILLKLRP